MRVILTDLKFTQYCASPSVIIYVVRWAIWYHLYNLKNVENTRGGMLFLSANFTCYIL